jgi:hypothetical protein
LTTSEKYIAELRAKVADDKVSRGFETPLQLAALELANEYAIAIDQNIRLERSIHALCKRIDELPSA